MAGRASGIKMGDEEGGLLNSPDGVVCLPLISPLAP